MAGSTSTPRDNVLDIVDVTGPNFMRQRSSESSPTPNSASPSFIDVLTERSESVIHRTVRAVSEVTNVASRSTRSVSGTGRSSSVPRHVEKKLSEGQRALACIRFRVGGALLAIVLLTFAGRMILSQHLVYLVMETQQPGRNEYLPPVLIVYRLALGVLAAFPQVILGMVPVPTTRAMRVVLLGQVLLLSPMCFESQNFFLWHLANLSSGKCYQFGFTAPLSICWTWLVFQGIRFVEVACSACVFCRALCLSTAKDMQLYMWEVIKFMTVVQTAGTSCIVLPVLYSERILHAAAYGIPGSCMALFFAWRPGMRKNVHAWFTNIVRSRHALRAAAGVAGLIGDCSAATALSDASSRFRVVNLAAVTFADMNSTSCDLDSGLYGISEPCKLGCCDAFVSHSWRDDAVAKWRELQKWRETFVHVRGREPVVWLDKWCLDQCNIAVDLRCLPVFLSGCQSLVVLCGTSYFSRLWCIAEIFTFVHMGGSLDQIHWVPVIRDQCARDDSSKIEHDLQDFDVEKCECSVEEDRCQMFAIIEAAYGSMESFSKAVQSVLAAKCDPYMHQMHSTSADGTVGVVHCEHV